MRLVCFSPPQLSSNCLSLSSLRHLRLCVNPSVLCPLCPLRARTCPDPGRLFIPFSLFPHVILSQTMEADIQFMQEALAEARSGAKAGEVPIGAVLIYDGKILARSGNRTIRDCDPTAHAEVIALREAARRLGNYRLAGTTLYVTIEPCSMCSGAILQARVPRLVYGADDPKGGAVRSCFEILSHPRLNHQVEVTSGVLAAECAVIIQSFFAARRE